MTFRVEGKEELLKSLDEARRLILEREKLLKERAMFAVKIRGLHCRGYLCPYK
jgi:hypothetical protein